MKVIDLFSGIGGFSLGLERAGHETIAFCEIDPYCQKVLRKHWPNVPIYEDIKTFPDAECSRQLQSQGRKQTQRGWISNLCVTAGFPCQDISCAGKQQGIEGERSGLWSELARVLGELRPQYAILENVSALLSGDRGRWFGRVLGDLAEIGYDCEWHCIPASYLGAPHRRDRVWIVAYPRESGTGLEEHRSRGQRGQSARTSQPKVLPQGNGASGSEGVGTGGEDVAYPNGQRQRQPKDETHASGDRGTTRMVFDVSDQGRELTESVEDVADTTSPRLQGWLGPEIARQAQRFFTSHDQQDGWWQSEPHVGRVAHGIPSRVDRLRCLGNAIVPQIAELIGNALNDD